MEQQLVSYVSNNDILSAKQSGFRSGYSCTSALSDVVDDIVKARNKGHATLLVLLDYTKAFDMLHHDITSALTWQHPLLCGLS